MTMIDGIDEFSYEGDLSGQADPIPFFEKGLSRIFDDMYQQSLANDKHALLILENDEVKRAMAFALEKLGACVHQAEPTDSYNFMLDTIANDDIVFIVGTTAGLKGLLKHSAKIRVDGILISDRYAPQSLINDLEAAWHCKAYEHYTRPELGGLGAFSCGKGAGYHMCDELAVEIIDHETGYTLKDGKWGELVLSSTFPASRPLVDYRCGDVTRIIKEKCPCGSRGIRIDKVKGAKASERFF